MVNKNTMILALALVVGTVGCLSEPPQGIAPSQPASTTVKMDFYHRPLPELPLPNDVATRFDPTSATQLRVNASMVAPTHFEMRVRELIDQIPTILEVTVLTRNGVEATVSVLSSWREKGVLQIELTKENLDLLLEDPRLYQPHSYPISQSFLIRVGLGPEGAFGLRIGTASRRGGKLSPK